MTKKVELVLVKTQVPAEVADQLKERAAAHERTVPAELRLAIRAYLADESEVAA